MRTDQVTLKGQGKRAKGKIGQKIADHFVQVNKMVTIGSGTQRAIKFLSVLDRAKEACVNSKQNIQDHFLHMEKMVGIGSGIIGNNREQRPIKIASPFLPGPVVFLEKTGR